jgi:hypothetical protein
MAKFANIKLELNKIKQLADVGLLKAEVNRLAAEIKKRGESELAQVERSVKLARARAQKLQKQIEQEVAKLRKQLAGSREKKATRSTAKRAGIKKARTKGSKSSGTKRQTT